MQYSPSSKSLSSEIVAFYGTIKHFGYRIHGSGYIADMEYGKERYKLTGMCHGIFGIVPDIGVIVDPYCILSVTNKNGEFDPNDPSYLCPSRLINYNKNVYYMALEFGLKNNAINVYQLEDVMNDPEYHESLLALIKEEPIDLRYNSMSPGNHNTNINNNNNGTNTNLNDNNGTDANLNNNKRVVIYEPPITIPFDSVYNRSPSVPPLSPFRSMFGSNFCTNEYSPNPYYYTPHYPQQQYKHQSQQQQYFSSIDSNHNDGLNYNDGNQECLSSIDDEENEVENMNIDNNTNSRPNADNK